MEKMTQEIKEIVLMVLPTFNKVDFPKSSHTYISAVSYRHIWQIIFEVSTELKFIADFVVGVYSLLL